MALQTRYTNSLTKLILITSEPIRTFLMRERTYEFIKQLSTQLLGVLLVTGLIVLLAPVSSYANKLRLKDITHVKGVRNNQLVGYGLVVGLR